MHAALEPGEPLDDEEVVVALGVADARVGFDAPSDAMVGFENSVLGNCAASAESSAAHASRSAAAASARARQLSDAGSVVATFASGTPIVINEATRRGRRAARRDDLPPITT